MEWVVTHPVLSISLVAVMALFIGAIVRSFTKVWELPVLSLHEARRLNAEDNIPLEMIIGMLQDLPAYIPRGRTVLDALVNVASCAATNAFSADKPDRFHTDFERVAVDSMVACLWTVIPSDLRGNPRTRDEQLRTLGLHFVDGMAEEAAEYVEREVAALKPNPTGLDILRKVGTEVEVSLDVLVALLSDVIHKARRYRESCGITDIHISIDQAVSECQTSLSLGDVESARVFADIARACIRFILWDATQCDSGYSTAVVNAEHLRLVYLDEDEARLFFDVAQQRLGSIRKGKVLV